MQAGPAIQPLPPISMTAAGMCAEAAKTCILPATRLRIDSSRPVLDEASLMPTMFGTWLSRSITGSVRSARWKLGLV